MKFKHELFSKNLSKDIRVSKEPDSLQFNCSCMYIFTKVLILSFPLLITVLGIQSFLKNVQALQWPEVPITISGSDAYSSYDKDSKSGEGTWSVKVQLFFTGTCEG
jgi:hypothetical protein